MLNHSPINDSVDKKQINAYIQDIKKSSISFSRSVLFFFFFRQMLSKKDFSDSTQILYHSITEERD